VERVRRRNKEELMDLQNLFGGLAAGGASRINNAINGVTNAVGNAVNGVLGNPPKVGGISQFKASFTTDVARQNRFDVQIPVPPGLLIYLGTSRALKYRCEGASLPGRSLATTEQKIYGPIEKYPYLTTYTDIDLTFIVDDDMNQKSFFDAWLNYINPLSSYNIAYKEDYSTALTINQYNVANELTYSVNLYEAFPISMNQLDLDWSGEGYHKLSVTFAFTTWESNSLKDLFLNSF
jgi:hypothetical protein